MNQPVKQIVHLIENNEKSILWSLILIILGAGTFYSIHLGNGFDYYYDENHYYTLANNLLHKHSFTLNGIDPSAYRPPGWPLMLMFLFMLDLDIIHARIFNFILLGISILLTYSIIKKQASPFAGLCGVLMIICYPVLFYTAGTFYPQNFGSLLFILIIFLISRTETFSFKNSIAIGLLFGLLILTVPTFIFALSIVLSWLFYYLHKDGFKTSITILVAVCLVLGLWTARNYKIYNTFAFVSTNGGINLLYSNSENTPYFDGKSRDISKYKEMADPSLNSAELSKYYQSKAIEYIENNKARVFKLYISKVLNYFNYKNNPIQPTDNNSLKNIIMIFTYGPFLILFIVRILSFKRFPFTKLERLLIILYFAEAFFSGIFYTRIRYRTPFDFLMIIVLATFISNIINKSSSQSYSTQ